MKCLVTGAAGFIGSHLVDRLLKEGHEVVGVDILGGGAVHKDAAENLRYIYRRHDLNFHFRPDFLPYFLPLLEDIEWVFHLAAKTGLQPWSFFQEYLEDNVLGTQRLLEACRQYCPNLKRFVYASTSSVYGKNAVGDEDIDINPCSPYGVTKGLAEAVCTTYARQYNLPVTILRYFSVYGPRQREGMAIRKWIDAALMGEPLQVCKGSLAHTRSLTYVDDVVEATLLTVQKDEAVGEVLNVAGEERLTMVEVIAQIICETGGKGGYAPCLSLREGDQEHTHGGISKANRLLGWWPRVQIEEGLKRQVEWQRNLMEGSK